MRATRFWTSDAAVDARSSKLASAATQGKVYGLDHAAASVAASQKTNAQWIQMGRVEVQLGSVSALPFPDNMFDLVTAVETHFWWSNLPDDMRETFRVVKPGGQFIAIAEIYKGANTKVAKMAEQNASRIGMALLSVEEHRELLANAGYSDVQVNEEPDKGWICALGRKCRPVTRACTLIAVFDEWQSLLGIRKIQLSLRCTRA